MHGAWADFNSRIFYNDGSKIQKGLEIMRGVMICIEKMFSYPRIHDKLNMQKDLCNELIDIVVFRAIVWLRNKKTQGKI